MSGLKFLIFTHASLSTLFEDDGIVYGQLYVNQLIVI